MNHEQLKRLEFILKRLTNKVDELDERVKHLEEHYDFELRKDIEEDINQLTLPLEDTNRLLSPLQDWETQ